MLLGCCCCCRRHGQLPLPWHSLAQPGTATLTANVWLLFVAFAVPERAPRAPHERAAANETLSNRRLRAAVSFTNIAQPGRAWHSLAQPGTAWHSLAQLVLAWHSLGESQEDGEVY